MNRDLRPIPLHQALPLMSGELYITMSEHQWDLIHSAGYQAGAILLELDQSEHIIRAFQREDAS
jgi:hypothetical protein